MSKPAANDLPHGFHPAVSSWFAGRFRQATEAQARAWAVTSQRQHALIAAPTGSGKTLAAFLSAINELVVEGLQRPLDDRVYVLYVSPLKALSNDVQKNLQAPLAGIRDRLLEMGLPDVDIRDGVRTGDTPQAERERMRRRPPQILVTTPESLFILLSSESGRRALRGVRSVIVDELHALAGSKRGAHLMLSLERLSVLVGSEPLRIGLSATVKPLERMARYLIGERPAPVAIVDTGHVRDRDLALELPESPLEAVMAGEVWAEVYQRLAELVKSHRTTLIFVNQRRLAERAARHIAERIGEEHVTAHHGSLSREHRLKAENRLKNGQLKCLVATASLELGIDIGDIDLVCQLGSPRSIAAFLQRVGRAGHAIGATPKGRLFPLSQDDLLECTALLDAAERGELDAIVAPEAPLDVLAQQIVGEVGSGEWPLDALYAMCCKAQPYAQLSRERFDQVIEMLAEGYDTQRGRRSAYVHLDAVNGRLRPRKNARLTAVTNAGVIPDQFDYEVILAPEGHRIGTLGEDFAFESLPGDIFQLGNTSFRVRKVETGQVIVEDADGEPPTMPFWFGEAPGRTDELSHAVARLNAQADALLSDPEDPDAVLPERIEALKTRLRELPIPELAVQQLGDYLAAARAALGALPTRELLIFERFFDEVGDTHLVIHAPLGSRINRAWGLALRKRFCRSFNFELQAAALEDSIILSLGPTHSFPLSDVAQFLKSASAREVLVQALLDAPMFATHWRWNACTALAIRRRSGDRRTPPQIQRSQGEDLLATVFPDQLACLENIAGDREIPEHPLVQQTIHDCLTEVMDVDGFLALVGRLERGEVRIVSRELNAPSPLAESILSAKPYAFLDDGDAENRRTMAVKTNRLTDADTAAGLARIPPEVLAEVLDEVFPAFASADELHDALLVHGALSVEELQRGHPNGPALAAALAEQGRATLAARQGAGLWIAAERLARWQVLVPELNVSPPIQAVGHCDGFEEALTEAVRGRLELLGPVTAETLVHDLGLPAGAIEGALLRLEGEGAVMRGDPLGTGEERWCERRILARLHRLARGRKRESVRSVPPAQFMRFLLRWQGLLRGDDDPRREGVEGLAAVLAQLEGCAVSAAAWEDQVLPSRVRRYTADQLDRLCASGQLAWCRAGLPANEGAGPVKTTPILFAPRADLSHWRRGAAGTDGLSGKARRLLDSLQAYGASFIEDLIVDTGQLRSEVEAALAELVARGLVNSDAFAGLRALLASGKSRPAPRGRRRQIAALDSGGRWALLRKPRPSLSEAGLADPAVEHAARVLLRRYGVVFRALLARESQLPPWRELFYVYRRLEARGEVLGGRFVQGFSGEQFALPEAHAALRQLPEAVANDEFVSLSAADPLNLLGVILPGDKLPALAGNRLLLEGGRVVATLSGKEVTVCNAKDQPREWTLRQRLLRAGGPSGALAASAVER